MSVFLTTHCSTFTNDLSTPEKKKNRGHCHLISCPVRLQLSAWRCSKKKKKTQSSTAAGNPADITVDVRAGAQNAAPVKFYMRLRIAVVKKRRTSVSCNFLLCRFHLSGQIENEIDKKFHTVACNIM